jgi:hypothetical protein
MATIYSHTFYEIHDLVGDGAAVGPPAGFLWVVRGLDCVNGAPENNIQLVGPAGQLVWANQFITPLGFAYASYRGRFVITTPETLFVRSTAVIDVTVWGYQLTLP